MRTSISLSSNFLTSPNCLALLPSKEFSIEKGLRNEALGIKDFYYCFYTMAEKNELGWERVVWRKVVLLIIR